MDRRSWLWRRKSSEKSPSGETESSGSLSSHSERFSDDQTLSNHNTQSPEVTSKAASGDELNNSVKTLSEKLSEALLNIRAKEDLVKQHAKVAEEAVSGWERAENEVLVLKKQNDALTQKNSILEERVGHLDGALKECLRELRQAREEQEEKIYDAAVKKSYEWEQKKSELENQIVDLHTQLQNVKAHANKALLADARSMLEAVEKENSFLRLKLQSKSEELELRITERDLSTHAAETASKQHLDSIRKVAKLEAECRRLKAVARKATLSNDQRSAYVESCADSQSDNGERALIIESDSGKTSGFEELGEVKQDRTHARTSLIVPSVEIDLMDDFLEMERLAALPVTRSASNPAGKIDGGETLLRAQLEAMINRTNELEENLQKITAEKVSLEIALNQCQLQLKASEDQLKQREVTLVDLKTQLNVANEAKRDVQKEVEFTKVKLMNSTKLLEEAEVNLIQIQDKLKKANEAKSIVEVQHKDANLKKAEAESQLKAMEVELESLHSSIYNLEKEVEKERKISRETVDKLTKANEAKSIVEVQLKDANLKKVEAESQLKAMEVELESLHTSIYTLEEEVEKERKFSREAVDKCGLLEAEISKMKSDSQFHRSAIIEEFRINQDKELAVAACKFAECQKTIASLDRQLKSLATLEDFLIESEGS